MDQSSNKAWTVAFDDSDAVKRFADLGYGLVPPQQHNSDYFENFVKEVDALGEGSWRFSDRQGVGIWRVIDMSQTWKPFAN